MMDDELFYICPRADDCKSDHLCPHDRLHLKLYSCDTPCHGETTKDVRCVISGIVMVKDEQYLEEEPPCLNSM
jgi:hypothetical protein